MVSSEPRWMVDGGRVMWEVLDGEAVIVDLASGRYHAATGTALTVWQAVAAGATLTGLAEQVRAAHPDAPADVDGVLAAFVADLVDAGLVVAAADGAPADDDPGAPGPADHADARAETPVAAPWAPPVLESHDDLEDLLLLDPVHDVSAEGWPQAGPPGS